MAAFSRQKSVLPPPPSQAGGGAEVIEGEITKVIPFDSGHAIVFLQNKKYEATLTGDLAMLKEGMSVRAVCTRTNHAKYGLQFKVTEIEESQFGTTDAIITYLSSNAFNGIGVSFARQVVEHFGLETLQTLDDNPEAVFDIPNVSQAKAQALVECWSTERALHRAMTELMTLGLSLNQAMKANKHFGSAATSTIRQEPYRLTEISGIGFKRADEVALKIGTSRKSKGRLIAAVKYVLDESARSGHCYLSMQELVEGTNGKDDGVVGLLRPDVSGIDVQTAVKDVAGAGGGAGIRYEQGRVYLASLYNNERFCAKKLTSMLANPRPPIYANIEALRAELDSLGVTSEFTLAPEQEQGLMNAMNSRVAVITGGPGCGKALSDDTLIPTPIGNKTMGSLVVGDVVFGSNGSPVSILGVYPQGKKQLYRVLFDDQTSVECSEDHLWSFQTKHDRRRGNTRTVLTTAEAIKKLEGGPREKLLYLPLLSNPASYGEATPVSIDPYLLGVILGDGSITTSSLRITNTDSDILNEVSKSLPAGVACIRDGVLDSYRLTTGKSNNTLNHNPLRKSLDDLGLMGVGSYGKFIPEIYLTATVKDRTELLKGLMDSDGTVSKNGYGFSYSSVSERLAKDVQRLAQSLGYKVTLRLKKGTYKKQAHISWRVTLVASGDTKLFRCSRKSLAQRSRTKYQPVRTVVSIKPTRIGNCTCIQVDASDKLFCANDFIVTHNTTITKALCQLMDAHRIQYRLCSPTGRAAKRLTECVGGTLVATDENPSPNPNRIASTIHRLLEYVPQEGGFNFNLNNPLVTDCVIADESSMIDIKLFYDLVSAMEDDDRLVLVGDANQLPSVGPGNVLRDIIASGAVPTVKLQRVFRQAEGSFITEVAHDILHGTVPQIPVPSKSKGKNCMFAGATEIEDLKEIILEFVSRILPSKGFKPSDIQVLTPMRERGLGINDLNPILQAAINPPAPQKTEFNAGIGRTFRVGDRVMQTKNNYDKGVFNGEQGEVVGIDRASDPVTIGVKFPDIEDAVIYEQSELDELLHAYAITVHRSQGSEFPVALVVVHPSHSIMLQRNLFYTALTRAKKLAIVVGTDGAVKRAVDNATEQARNTTLKQLLKAGG